MPNIVAVVVVAGEETVAAANGTRLAFEIEPSSAAVVELVSNLLQ